MAPTEPKKSRAVWNTPEYRAQFAVNYELPLRFRMLKDVIMR